MGSEDKTYILRKPINPELKDGWQHIKDFGINQVIREDLFEELFVEFSVDATRKQIEELFYEYEFDADSSTDITFDPDKLPLFINKVLALLGGTTNGK